MFFKSCKSLYFSLGNCRYEDLAESVEDYVLDVLRDQLNRRQPMDNVSRNLLRLLTATCGYKEARFVAVQRLEMWLQNPKVSAATIHRILCLYLTKSTRTVSINQTLLLAYIWLLAPLDFFLVQNL